MRCKNCGYENDDKLYICENCGSPLYDEEDIPQEDDGATIMFSAIDDKGEKPIGNATDNSINDDNEDDKKKKQTTITIIVLAIVLLSIIIGIIVGAVSRSNKNEPTTAEITTQQTTEEQAEPTSPTTAPTTTTTTTEPSTEAQKLIVTLTCNTGGKVEGDGEYMLGDNATLIARPDDGYEFAGWYNGNTKVSSSAKYKFTVTESIKLKAVFVIVQIEDDTTVPTTEAPTEGTTQNEVDTIIGEDD